MAQAPKTWEEAWQCICKGKKHKEKICPSIYMSEYYCAYCHPKEAQMLLARKNALIEARKKKETEKRKNPIVVAPSATGSKTEDCDDAILSGFQPCFNGRHWRLGFPRGNYLPKIKVRMPEDWRPSKACSGREFEETLMIQGACPCCGNSIAKAKPMIK